MEKKHVGKPKIVLPKEMIKEILYLFMKEKKISGLISYMDVLRYSEELIKNGMLEKLREKYKHQIINESKIKDKLKLKEHFWRKGDGRRAIDTANEILQYQVPGAMDKSEKVVDTFDAVEKFFSGKETDKQKLFGALHMNELKLKRYIKENQELKEKIINLEKRLEVKKARNEEWKAKAESYERVLFSWLDASMSKDTPLIDLMTTGQSRHPIVQHMFQTVFSDPVIGYKDFENYRQHEKETQSNVIPIEQLKHRSVLDDIKI